MKKATNLSALLGLRVTKSGAFIVPRGHYFVYWAKVNDEWIRFVYTEGTKVDLFKRD